jgi:hypothetical protein
MNFNGRLCFLEFDSEVLILLLEILGVFVVYGAGEEHGGFGDVVAAGFEYF